MVPMWELWAPGDCETLPSKTIEHHVEKSGLNADGQLAHYGPKVRPENTSNPESMSTAPQL